MMTNIIDLTNNSGPPGGLELVLDAQQYEYMYYASKENYAAGIVFPSTHTSGLDF